MTARTRLPTLAGLALVAGLTLVPGTVADAVTQAAPQAKPPMCQGERATIVGRQSHPSTAPSTTT